MELNAAKEGEKPLLDVRDLRVNYGNIEALHGISLDVGPGEIVALLGANGAGKTTTLRTISGLLRPRGGSIAFEGQAIVGLPSHRVVALGIGHVPEGRRIFGGLTVEENLRLGGYLLRRDAAALDHGIDQAYETFVRLRERKDQLAGTLSGGEQQMLAIARALMLKPKLVLLDEPSMGLAPKLVRAIFEVIARISSAGTAVLLVEQNARQALRIANRAYVLEGGRVALSGSARELAGDNRVRATYLGGSALQTGQA
jgi:branched-chain amino acid transport system ATP-binding protein